MNTENFSFKMIDICKFSNIRDIIQRSWNNRWLSPCHTSGITAQLVAIISILLRWEQVYTPTDTNSHKNCYGDEYFAFVFHNAEYNKLNYEI